MTEFRIISFMVLIIGMIFLSVCSTDSAQSTSTTQQTAETTAAVAATAPLQQQAICLREILPAAALQAVCQDYLWL